MKKTALVIGSTGLVGKKLVKQLCSDADYSAIYALVRSKSAFIDDKLTEIIVNFDQLENTIGLPEINHIYCCLGTTIKKAGTHNNFKKVDYEYILSTSKLGLSRGATKMLVVSALGANSKSTIFYNRVKGEMEEALMSLNFESVHIFRPSMLGGHRNEFRLGEKIGSFFLKLFGWMLIGKAKRYKIIEDYKVAKAMIKASKDTKKGVIIIESEEMQ